MITADLDKFVIPRGASCADICADKELESSQSVIDQNVVYSKWHIWEEEGSNQTLKFVYFSKTANRPVSVMLRYTNDGVIRGEEDFPSLMFNVSSTGQALGRYVRSGGDIPEVEFDDKSDVFFESFVQSYKEFTNSLLLKVGENPTQKQQEGRFQYSHCGNSLLEELVAIERWAKDWIDKDALGNKFYYSRLGIGGHRWFCEGHVHDYSETLNRALAEVRENSFAAQYELRWHELHPESWAKREKRRKKLKKEELQDLGILTLENGFEVSVKIEILAEGYRYYLDFFDKDGMGYFPETRLFKKTEWLV
ncbi:hypothetical protein [Rubritalea tangerina]|uniref:hypothetical protein n=1 Tax=Rubritalea tangerina TaxID=430798 RepID=UPI00360CC20A